MQIPKSRGSVIITTQETPLKYLTDIEIPLEPLDPVEGGNLLLHCLPPGSLEEPVDESLAVQIAEFVGGLPVAIAHVAGYIAYSQCPLDELLEIFQQRKKSARPGYDISSSFRDSSFSYDETLSVVWNIALRELPGDCQDLIYILSYLNGESVSEKLIWAAHTDPALEFLHIDEKIRFVLFL